MPKLNVFFSLVATLLLFSACAELPRSAASNRSVDLLIRNGRLVDGTGNSWFLADVAIHEDKIVAIGKLDHFTARRTIDAQRQIVAPGFIDVHAHIESGVFDNPNADNYIHDGVTTVITGNCGGSADQLERFLARIDTVGTSINVASLVGHNTVRQQVMGLANRPASSADQQSMEALVEQAMRQGAVGLSTGLIYLPGLFSNTEEVIGLARVAAKHGGLYTSHIRDEGSRVVEAINEAVNVGRSANLPVQISHFKVSAPANWGRSRETLALIELARSNGLDVTIDQYPYTASSTSLGVVLPDWAVEGGDAEIRKRLADSVQRAQIAKEILASARRNKRADFSYAVVARHAADPQLNNKNLSAINLKKGRPPTMEAEIETLLDVMAVGGAQMVFHGMNEEDVRTIMRYPFSMIAADGGVQNGQGVTHPRSYGTNARVLGKYVREEKIITLEEAIRRMTSLAAQKFRLKDRGLLREGFAADIVIFNDQQIIDQATFDSPHQFSTGISYVMVNGKIALEAGSHTGARNGVALRGPAYSSEF